MESLMKTATCNCGQLTIDTLGPPELTTGSKFNHRIHGSANFVYFDTGNIDCTHGDAHCTTRHHENQTTNYYHCPECLSELFAVPQEMPSIVAIYSRCFQNLALLAGQTG